MLRHPLKQKDIVMGSQRYTYGECNVMLSGEAERKQIGWHMSVSCPDRYPTWDELAELRDALLPAHIAFVMHFPPPEEYVNVHNFCLHLHQDHTR